MKYFSLKILVFSLIVGPLSFAETSATTKDDRLKKIEERLLDIEADLAIIRKHTDELITRATIGYLNAIYLKAGLSLLFPRDSDFLSSTDTGLGAFVGAGKYFGSHHLIDAAIEWDFYPSLAIRYKYDLHFKSPAMSFGPIAGIKLKLFDADPFDQFITVPSEAKSFYFLTGLGVGIQLGRSILNIEVLGLINKGQLTLVSTAGIHFFY